MLAVYWTTPLTLEQFIQQAKLSWPQRQRRHLQEPEFSYLYVRYTGRYILGKACQPVLDIASIEARKPGKGAFTRLLQQIRTSHPELPIFIEAVINPRFGDKLKALGFQDVGPDLSPCFYMPTNIAPNDGWFVNDCKKK
jgi:hypothetical protein